MPRASTVNHISWQSRIWNKWNLPSAPVPGHFPSLMTVVTLQAQYCSPALQWQKSPVEMSLPSPCAFPNNQCGQDQDPADLWTCQGSLPSALCDTDHLWPAVLHPCPTLGPVTASWQSCPCTVPTPQVSFHQESQGEWGLLGGPAASPLQAMVLEHQS